MPTDTAIQATPEGLVLASAAGAIAIAWADVPAVIEAMRKVSTQHVVDAHLARHGRLGQ